MSYDYLFLSPHFDDAALSCGGFITKLINLNKSACVITVFTKGTDPCPSGAARDFVKSCGEVTARRLFAKRRKEDIRAMKILGCSYLHLGFVDGLFRTRQDRHQHPKALYPSVKQLLCGKISPSDHSTIESLAVNIQSLINKMANKHTLVYGPLGVGNHVDHLIVYQVLANVFCQNLCLWEDVPYRIFRSLVSKRLGAIAKTNDLQRQSLLLTSSQIEVKHRAILAYSSQRWIFRDFGLNPSNYHPEVVYLQSLRPTPKPNRSGEFTPPPLSHRTIKKG